jgi:hypothetical protein
VEFPIRPVGFVYGDRNGGCTSNEPSEPLILKQLKRWVDSLWGWAKLTPICSVISVAGSAAIPFIIFLFLANIATHPPGFQVSDSSAETVRDMKSA